MRNFSFRFAALMALTALTLVTQACSFTLVSLNAGSSDRGKVALEEIQPSKHFWTEDEILMIPLSGMVTTGDMNTDRHGDAGMLVELKDRLDAARKDRRIRAVVLRVDSPGGTVTASDLIYHEIMLFKKETKLPVIVLMGDMAASGGLYVSMAADEIYALPTTVTGSIGVIVMSPNLEGLMDKIGVSMNVIKSGKIKDAGAMWRSLTPEERRIFQGVIDENYKIFCDVICRSRGDRGLTREALAKIADGRILTPKQAKATRLIDGILYPNDVYKRAMNLAKIADASVVSYEYPGGYRGNVYASAPSAQPGASSGGGGGGPTVNLFPIGGRDLMQELFSARFLYMRAP